MRAEDLATPLMPARYATLILDVVGELGCDPRSLLRRAGMASFRVEDPDERVPLTDIARLATAAMAMTDQPGLGYEIGLRSSVTSHGIMGFGMMSAATVRDAIGLGIEFLALRVPVLAADLRVEDGRAAVVVTGTTDLGGLHRALFDTVLVKLARIGSSLSGGSLDLDEVELWFDYPEPDYHRAMRERLPAMRFDMGSNEIRFDAAVLDVHPDAADPLNVRLIEQQCRRELEQLGLSGDPVAQVRAILADSQSRYPTLGEVAALLHVSERTLKRRLHQNGTSFGQLLDAERRARAIRLLSSTALPVEQIARRLGYADASGFRRAFHTWTGTRPSDFREQLRR